MNTVGKLANWICLTLIALVLLAMFCPTIIEWGHGRDPATNHSWYWMLSHGSICHYERTGYDTEAVSITPLWWALVPLSGWPLIWLKRLLKSDPTRATGFPVESRPCENGAGRK